MIQNYVENVYVINLDRREERWEHVQNQLKKYNIDVERFSAVDGYEHPKKDEVDISRGELGCSLSHKQVLEDARKNDYETICVFEDDIIFEDGFEWRFKEYYKQLPEDWEFVYLGGNDMELKNYSENVKIAKKVLTTHSYLVKRSMYEKILSRIEENAFGNPIDNLYSRIQWEETFYIFKPKIVIQKEGYSDVRGGHRNYNDVLKDL